MRLTKNSSGRYVNVISYDDKIVIIEGGSVSSVIAKQHDKISGTALADLKEDGNNYIIFADGELIRAYNIHGVPAEYFPFADPSGRKFDRYILAADFEGDNSSEIISVTEDGRIFAIDGVNR